MPKFQLPSCKDLLLFFFLCVGVLTGQNKQYEDIVRKL